MALKEKLKMFHFSDEENKKATEKFLVALSLVSEDDIKEIATLKSKGIEITHARDIKVLTISKEELAKKISILEEIGEVAIYSQDPSLLCRNVIDIYKKIKYCRQIGKPYKKEDGTYEAFLFNESAWQKAFNNVDELDVNAANNKIEEDIVTIEPETDTLSSMDSLESAISDSISSINNSNYMDIDDFKSTNSNSVSQEAKTTDFATVRQELQKQLADLDALKNTEYDDVISFADIGPESYGIGMGR